MKSKQRRTPPNPNAVVSNETDDSRAGEPQSQRAIDAPEPQTPTTPTKIPLAASRVATLPQAVEISLNDGLDEDSIFIFCRAILAFQITHAITLKRDELDNAFNLWWATAHASLPKGASRLEYHMDFMETFSRVRVPHGANPLDQAIKLADTRPWPDEAIPYAADAKPIGRLIAVCYHLQGLAGNDPFFLGLRDAAKILGTTSQVTAGKRMHGLCVLEILSCTWKAPAGGKKASRYRYVQKQTPK